MKAITMEQEVFESSINDYVTKKIDPDNGSVSYVLNRKFKTTLINVREGKKVTKTSIEPEVIRRGGRRVHTPSGWFDNAYVAAEEMNLSIPTIYNRVRSNSIEYREWYYEKG